MTVGLDDSNTSFANKVDSNIPQNETSDFVDFSANGQGERKCQTESISFDSTSERIELSNDQSETQIPESTFAKVKLWFRNCLAKCLGSSNSQEEIYETQPSTKRDCV
jgi:hypothetical protein